MDPQEFLSGLSDEALTDLGHDGTSFLPISRMAEEFGINLGTPPVRLVIDGLQHIHDAMRDRGMIVEAQNLWERLNTSTPEPFFGPLVYTDLYPNT